MKKRVLAMLLAVMMVISLFPTTAFATDDPEPEQVVVAEPEQVVEPAAEPVEETAPAEIEMIDLGTEEVELAMLEDGGNVAKIVDAAGEVVGQYTTIKAAFDALVSGQKIVLLADCECDQLINFANGSGSVKPYDGQYAIDFNGHKITFTKSGAYLDTHHNFDFYDTVGGGMFSEFGVVLSVESNQSAPVINIYGGTFHNGMTSMGAFDSWAAVMAASQTEHQAKFTIHDGAVIDGLRTGTADFDIQGGTFNKGVLAEEKSEIAISGGTFNAELLKPNGFSTPVAGVEEGCTAKISGGTFSKLPDNNLLTDDAEIVVDGKTYTKGEGDTPVPTAPASTAVAKIGTTEYATLAEAIAAAKTGDTITLLQNVTVKVGAFSSMSGDFTFTGITPETKLILDVKGDAGNHEFVTGDDTSSHLTFKNMTVERTLTGKDSWYGGFKHTPVTFDHCTILGTITTYGKTVFDTCTFKNSVYVSGGEIKAQYGAFVYGNDTVIKDCIFDSNGRAIKFYNEAASGEKLLVVDSCTFNFNGTQDKNPIEVNSAKGADYVVALKGTNTATGTFQNMDLVKTSGGHDYVIENATFDENGKLTGGKCNINLPESVVESFVANGYAPAEGEGVWNIEPAADPDLAILAANNITEYTKIANGFYMNKETYAKSTEFYITSLDGLKAFREQVNGTVDYSFARKTIKLLADVDLSGENWTPIGNKARAIEFEGLFDGGNHTIKNLTIDSTESNIGLFGKISGQNGWSSTGVKNLNFTDPNVKGAKNVGVVAGQNQGTIDNVKVTGIIKVEATTDYYISACGVIAGYSGAGYYKNISVDGTNPENSYATGKGRYIAGIAGHLDDAKQFENCIVKNISINGDWLCGGVAGNGPAAANFSGMTVENIIMSANYSGGVFGWYYDADGGADDNKGVVNNVTVTDVAFTKTGNNGAIGGYSMDANVVVKDIVVNNVTGASLEYAAKNNEGYYFATVEKALEKTEDASNIRVVASDLTKVDIPAGYELVQYSDGTYGVEEKVLEPIDNVYHITSMDDLNTFRSMVNGGNDFSGKTVVLDNNITFEGTWDTGIGGASTFNGTFDGNGKTISGLKITGNSNYIALFGHPWDADIKNLTLANPVISNTATDYTGAVCGSGYARVSNVTVTGGSVTGVEQVGAIIGYLSCGSVKNCTVNGTVITANTDRVGGIAGKANVDSQYVISGNTVSGVTVKGAISAALVGQIMTGSGNTWQITDNNILNVTVKNGNDETAFNPIGNFRSGSYQADTVSGGHIVRNHWEPATTPDSYTMVNPADNTQSVVIENFYPVCEIVGGVRYATLAAAVAAAKDGETVKLLDNCDTTAPIEIADKAITLDLNGKTVEYKGSTTNNTGVFVVHNGAALTVNDGNNTTNTGKIVSGEKCYAAIALTKKDDDPTNPAKVTVNGGQLIGDYYGIVTNGNRDNTEIVVTGGTVKGTHTNDNIGIFNPNNGKVTVTGGTIEGYSSAIELRGGELNVSGGTLTSTATAYSVAPNGSGNTTVGAAVAIAQHNTKKPVTVSITGGTLAGVNAVSVANPQNNDTTNVAVTLGAATYTGALAFSADGNATVTKTVNAVPTAPEGYKWVNNTLVACDYVLTIKAENDTATAEIAALMTGTDFTADMKAFAEYAATHQNTYKTHTDKYGIELYGKVTLTDDIVVPSNVGWSSTMTIFIFKDTVIDLNGHTITQQAGTGSSFALFNVKEGATLTIIDGSEGGSGKISATMEAIENYGTVELNGGTIALDAHVSAADSAYSPIAIYNVSGEVELNGGKIEAPTKRTDKNGNEYEMDGFIAYGEAVDVPTGSSFVLGEGYIMGDDITGINNASPEEGMMLYDYGNGLFEVTEIVAKIGTNNYAYLDDAVAAAKDGDTVVLQEDIDLGDYGTTGLTINSDKDFTLDLAGKKITGNTTASGTSQMILNKGDLTIKDSVGGGTIVSGATPAWQYNDDYNYAGSYASNTIRNEGSITLESGKIFNNTSGYAAYGIDNYNSGIVNITGGEIETAFAAAVRMFYGTGSVSVSGDSVLTSGKRFALQLMGGNTEATISGGTFNSNGTVEDDTKYSISTYDAPNCEIEVTGGTFTGKIYADSDIAISGGTFSYTFPAEYCAPGFEPKENGDGTYGVDTIKVAQIGDAYFATLADAVAAAKDGDTVTLLKDATGDGIQINKNIIIDLGGNTYTVNGNLTGSTGTKTQAFQLLAGNNVTIKNGTITTTAEAQAKMLIQNYSNLTLDNVKLDGTNLTGTKYTLSNNNGDILFKTGTEIIAAEGGVAYDLYDWASGSAAYTGVSLTIEDGVTVTGKTEVGGDRDVLNVNVKAPETMLPEAPADYKWVDGENGEKVLAPKTYVAQIGEQKYESLAEAIAAVGNGETITLLGNITSGGITVPSGKNFTLNFNGKTLTFECPGAGSAGTKTAGFQLLKNSTIEFKNGTIQCSAANKDKTWVSTDTTKGIAIIIQNYANLTLTGMTIDGTNIAHNGAPTRYVLSNNSGNVVIDGTTINTASGDVAFDTCKYGDYTAPTVVVKGTSVINGDVALGGGNLTLTAGTLNGNLKDDGIGDGVVTKTTTFTNAAPAGYKWDDSGKLVKDASAEYSFSLSLEDSISINFYVNNLTGTPEKYTVEYTFNGVTKEVQLTNEKTNHIVVADCAPKQAGDKVYIKVKYDGEVIREGDYSVRTYCENKIETSQDEKLVALCKAVLDYGAYAQQRFNYKTDELVNATYSAGTVPTTVIPEALNVQKKEGTCEGITKISSSLSLESKTEINFYFTPAKDANIVVTAVLKKQSGDVALEVITRTLGDGRIYVSIPGIAAKEVDLPVEVTVSDGTSSIVLTYSPLTFAVKNQADGKKDALVCRALYLYNTAAKEYFAEKNK